MHPVATGSAGTWVSFAAMPPFPGRSGLSLARLRSIAGVAALGVLATGIVAFLPDPREPSPIAVDVHVDGRLVETVVAPVDSVAGVLDHAGLIDARDNGAVVVPGWTSPVAHGDRVFVWTPQPVTVVVDGDEIELASVVSDVASLMVEQGIELGPDDIVSVPRNEPLEHVDFVEIERVEYTEVVEQQVLARPEVTEETDELPRGASRIVDEGADGVREYVFRVRVVEGDPEEWQLVSERVATAPQPRIIEVGTAEPAIRAVTVDPSGAPALDDPVWDELAHCESRGNWSNISANGMYYGGLQFLPSTWRSVGGTGMPHEASRDEQILRAQILQQRSGWGQWPHCSRVLGLR